MHHCSSTQARRGFGRWGEHGVDLVPRHRGDRFGFAGAAAALTQAFQDRELVPHLGRHEALFGAPAEHRLDPPDPGVDHVPAQAPAVEHGLPDLLQVAQSELVGRHVAVLLEHVVEGVVEVHDLAADPAGAGVEELAFGPHRELGRQLRQGRVGARRPLRPAPRRARLGVRAGEVGGHHLAVAELGHGAAVRAEVDLAALAVRPAQEDDVGAARLVVDDRGEPWLLHDSAPDVS